ncbi:MAG: Mannose-1-phosphate guanylyltransferase (GDP) [Candidatus Moranbacteria bacterium GW2011_GWF2_44_10]|nr:MAG: Mannose-1-phosphate guanylyltransferase (GDP) [Candidatus Moranbacteria bacterium GW2011_GWF2_44_10]
MAGGRGTRLWPMSRQGMPKQFQKLVSEKTMLQDTFERLRNIVEATDIFVSTNKEYVEIVKKQLPKMPAENVIAEPVGRNTAPCIALSAAIISAKNGNETIGFFPADHFIKNPEGLLKAIQEGEKILEKYPANLLTFGISPTAPETGYGYIEKGELLEKIDSVEFFKAKRFVEKPDLETAQEYLDSGDFFWNSGMFLFKTDTIIERFRAYVPDIYERLVKIKNVVGKPDFEKILEEEFPRMDKISIDYAVMENEPNVIVIPISIDWSDVGSWTALKDTLIGNNKEHLVKIKGEHLDFNSENLLVYGDDKLVVTIGAKDLIIVDTPDAILIADRNKSQMVSDVVKKLEESGNIKHL